MDSIYTAKRPSIPTDIARAIKIESGHCCAVNQCSEHTYLEIHHIDHNRENNDPGNLILLCDKHHKMAHADIIDRKALRLYKELLAAAILNPVPEHLLDPATGLKIVDLYEVESCSTEDDDPITTIELKLVNRGKHVAFVKEVRVTMLKHWETLTDHNHSLVPISATYDLKIRKEVGSVSRVKVHHEVKPQETERVAFRLETDYDSDPNGLSLFLIKLEVLHDEISSVVLAPLIIVNIRPRYASAGSYFPGYQQGTIPQNKAVASEVLCLAHNGTLVNQDVINALESWKNAPEESEYFAGAR
ncbi:HNH endonuclease signature motif containing protein [Pseudomonas brassicacearum]|nr:HNH endonuclease signature motif containing protein [Pseudomonas brassicacearum]